MHTVMEIMVHVVVHIMVVEMVACVLFSGVLVMAMEEFIKHITAKVATIKVPAMVSMPVTSKSPEHVLLLICIIKQAVKVKETATISKGTKVMEPVVCLSVSLVVATLVVVHGLVKLFEELSKVCMLEPTTTASSTSGIVLITIHIILFPFFWIIENFIS